MNQKDSKAVKPKQVSKFVETEEDLAFKPVKIGNPANRGSDENPDEFEEVDLDEWLDEPIEQSN